MFAGAKKFNQPIGPWDVSQVADYGGFTTNPDWPASKQPQWTTP